MSIAPPEADPSLPSFVPSSELVEATASAMMGEEVWGEAEKLVRFHASSQALEILTAVGDQLLAAALDHITDHHTAFGFDERLRDELMFARMASDIAGLDSTDDDTVPKDTE